MTGVVFWALVPPVSGELASLTATVLCRDDIPETVGVPLLAALVGGIVAHVELSVIPSPTGQPQGSIAGYTAGTAARTGLPAADPVATVAVTLLLAAGGFQLIRRETLRSVTAE